MLILIFKIIYFSDVHLRMSVYGFVYVDALPAESRRIRSLELGFQVMGVQAA